jgi:hypothetical protein
MNATGNFKIYGRGELLLVRVLLRDEHADEQELVPTENRKLQTVNGELLTALCYKDKVYESTERLSATGNSGNFYQR